MDCPDNLAMLRKQGLHAPSTLDALPIDSKGKDDEAAVPVQPLPIDASATPTLPDLPERATVDELPPAEPVARNRTMDEKAREITALVTASTTALEQLPEANGMPDVPFFGSRAAPTVATAARTAPAAKKGAAAKGAAVKGPKPKPKPTPCETEPQEEEDEKEHSDGHFSVHDDSADDDSSDDTEADEEAEYTVERIVAERTKADGKKEYKIKWKGYTLQTWEPEKNILDRSVLDEFDAVKAAKVSISPHALFRPPALTDVGCVVSVQVAKASKPLQPAPEPTPEPTPVMAVRMAKVVADQPVSLRVRATTDANAKDFNGAVVSSPDEVEILASEDKEGSTFYYIKAGRKKGFIKAAYVQEISAVLCAEI
jgi:hypothetical protein